MEASVNPNPKSGPPNTVLLEVRNPHWKQNWSEPQTRRFWIDPTHGYLVMRREELAPRHGKEAITGGYAIEQVVQDPRARWYPSVVRQFKCVGPVGTDDAEDRILRLYYDFTTPIPQSVFKAD
jgi:hypothetical protein